MEPIPAPIAPARAYDPAELRSDAAVHAVGLAMAIAAVPVLIAWAMLWRGDAAAVLAVSIYGATLIAMLGASLAYNHLPHPGHAPEIVEARRALLRRFDMSAIYLKIAGTVTPFAVLSGTGWAFMAGMWGAALLASASLFLRRRRSGGVSVAIALGMGWAVLIGGGELVAAVSRPVFWLMLAGGVLYSLGTPFLLAGRMRFHNTIWHGFVVAASAVFFVAVAGHLAGSAAL
jgi:hemolysin III